MKNLYFILLILIVSMLTMAYADDSKDDRKLVEGKWVPISAELAGTALPEALIKTWLLDLKDGKYTFKNGAEVDQGTWKLDVTKKPKTIEIKGTEGPNKGKTILTIYELTDDTLKVCYDLSGKEYPAEFKTKADTQLFLVTYKRKTP